MSVLLPSGKSAIAHDVVTIKRLSVQDARCVFLSLGIVANFSFHEHRVAICTPTGSL